MFLGFFPKWCSAVVVRMKRLVGRDPKGNVSFPLRAGRPDLRSAAGSRSKARTNWWLFPPLSRDDAATCFVSAVACLLACCLLAACLLARSAHCQDRGGSKQPWTIIVRCAASAPWLHNGRPQKQTTSALHR